MYPFCSRTLAVHLTSAVRFSLTLLVVVSTGAVSAHAQVVIRERVELHAEPAQVADSAASAARGGGHSGGGLYLQSRWGDGDPYNIRLESGHATWASMELITASGTAGVPLEIASNNGHSTWYWFQDRWKHDTGSRFVGMLGPGQQVGVHVTIGSSEGETLMLTGSLDPAGGNAELSGGGVARMTFGPFLYDGPSYSGSGHPIQSTQEEVASGGRVPIQIPPKNMAGRPLPADYEISVAVEAFPADLDWIWWKEVNSEDAEAFQEEVYAWDFAFSPAAAPSAREDEEPEDEEREGENVSSRTGGYTCGSAGPFQDYEWYLFRCSPGSPLTRRTMRIRAGDLDSLKLVAPVYGETVARYLPNGVRLEVRLQYGESEYCEYAVPQIPNVGGPSINTENWPAIESTCEIDAVYLQFIPGKVDLLADSDNDGQLTADDEAAEFDSLRVGALIPLNDDDDDGDDVLDYEDDYVLGEDDLEELRVEASLQLEPGAAPAVRLEALTGLAGIRLWETPEKQTEVELPADLDYDDLPVSFYVEGASWEDSTATLRLSVFDLNDEDAEYGADTLTLYAGPLGLSLPEAAEAGADPFAILTGLPAEAEVDFEVYRNGALVQSATTAIEGLSATLEIDASASQTSPGDVYRLVALADQGALRLEATTTVVPGPPATVELLANVVGDPARATQELEQAVRSALASARTRADGETEGVALPSDGYSSAYVSALFRDLHGNPVLDGYPVSWSLEGAGAFITSIDTTTFGLGVSAAVLQAGPFGDVPHVITVQSGEAEAELIIESLPVEITLAATAASVEIDADQPVSIVATFVDTAGNPVRDGTPVEWVSSKGKIIGSTTVSGGVAAAELRADTGNQTTGTAVITASVGNNVGRREIRFVPPDGCLYAELQLGGQGFGVLVGDRAMNVSGTTASGPLDFGPNGYGVQGDVVQVERLDGTMAEVPVFSALEGIVYGEANTSVVVTVPLEARKFIQVFNRPTLEATEAGFGFTGRDGQIVVEIGDDGVGHFLVGSLGAFTDEAFPDEVLYKTQLSVSPYHSTIGRLSGICLAGTTVDVVLVKEAFWADFVATLGEGLIGFITGQGDSGAVVAADLILGSMPGLGIYADGRDLVLSLAGMASGDDSASALVASFALFGLATELPWFKGSADVVVNYAKVLIKRLGDAPLARVLSGQVVGSIAQSLASRSLDPIMRELAFLRKLGDADDTFLNLARGMVKSDADYAAMRTLAARLANEAGDDLTPLLTRLSADYGPDDVMRAMRSLASETPEVVGSLKSLGKLDFASKGLASGGWDRVVDGKSVTERYISQVDHLGASSKEVERIDALAEVPGSWVHVKNKISNSGQQFEMSTAIAERKAGYSLEELGLDLFKPNGNIDTDVDVVSLRAAIESKGGKNLRGLRDKLGKYKNFAPGARKEIFVAVNYSEFPNGFRELPNRLKEHLKAHGLTSRNVLFVDPATDSYRSFDYPSDW